MHSSTYLCCERGGCNSNVPAYRETQNLARLLPGLTGATVARTAPRCSAERLERLLPFVQSGGRNAAQDVPSGRAPSVVPPALEGAFDAQYTRSTRSSHRTMPVAEKKASDALTRATHGATCDGCGVTVRWMDGAEQSGLPASWTKSRHGTHC